MIYLNAVVWIIISGIAAVIGCLLTVSVFGGDVLSSFVIAFAGGFSGVYIFEYAKIEVSTGNRYVDQFVIALVGAIAFAMIAAALGLNLENLSE